MFATRDIPKRLAGTAMTGFGLSLGRDAYRTVKDHISLLILLTVVFVSFFSVYQIPIWLFRNYRTILGGFALRLSLIPVYAAAFYIGGVTLTISFIFLFGTAHSAGVGFPALIASTTMIDIAAFFLTIYKLLIFPYQFITGTQVFEAASQSEVIRFLTFSEDAQIGSLTDLDKFYLLSFLIGSLCLLVLTLLGVTKGLRQRSARRQAWAAEEHNRVFLSNNGLTEIGDDKYRDADGNGYRVSRVFADRIELSVIGRRNRGGYITFDNKGRFLTWSGMEAI